MRMILILISILFISSCVLHDHYQREILKTATADRVYTVNQNGRLTLCEPWVPPYLPPPPIVPEIPEKLLGNKDAELEIIIKSLEAHRRHIREIREISKTSYDDYVKRCTNQVESII